MPLPTTSITLSAGRPLSTGLYRVALRVTFDRKQKYYRLPITLSKEDFNKTMGPNPRGVNKENKGYFESVESRAIKIIRELADFSFSEFERRFNQSSAQRKKVVDVLSQMIKDLTKQGRTGTARSYNNALVSLQMFLDSKNQRSFEFSSLTVSWLQAYERWILDRGNTISTAGIYIRPIRAAMNIAIAEGNFKREESPFGKTKYTVPSSQNIKKALSSAELKKVFEYEPDNDAEKLAQDMWIFSYLCSGINFKDIAKLRYSNLGEASLQFVRSKTERSGRVSTHPIEVPLGDVVRKIIDRWGVKPRKPTNFIFGIIDDSLSPEVQEKRIQQAIKTNNKYTKRIGKKLGLKEKLTTYTARHSFATMMMRKEASIALISESLGHKNIATTQKYLGSFENKTKKDFQDKLLEFE